LVVVVDAGAADILPPDNLYLQYSTIRIYLVIKNTNVQIMFKELVAKKNDM